MNLALIVWSPPVATVKVLCWLSYWKFAPYNLVGELSTYHTIFRRSYCYQISFMKVTNEEHKH